ncbi:hypothetical protein GCM10009577_37960 [Streptomyces javensis]
MIGIASTAGSAVERAEAELGPRVEGAYYWNETGTYEVLAVLRGEAAREAVVRRTDWAVRTRHLATDHVTTHCMVWTDSDHLISVPSSSAGLVNDSSAEAVSTR